MSWIGNFEEKLIYLAVTLKSTFQCTLFLIFKPIPKEEACLKKVIVISPKFNRYFHEALGGKQKEAEKCKEKELEYSRVVWYYTIR